MIFVGEINEKSGFNVQSYINIIIKFTIRLIFYLPTKFAPKTIDVIKLESIPKKTIIQPIT